MKMLFDADIPLGINWKGFCMIHGIRCSQKVYDDVYEEI